MPASFIMGADETLMCSLLSGKNILIFQTFPTEVLTKPIEKQTMTVQNSYSMQELE